MCTSKFPAIIARNTLPVYRAVTAMEDQTQAVLGDEEDDQGDQEESDINPVGYLRVLSQKDLEQTDYPVQEGVCVCMSVCVSE